jgi:hypothetical protein
MMCFTSIDAGMWEGYNLLCSCELNQPRKAEFVLMVSQGSDLVLNKRLVERLQELLPMHGQTGKRLCHLENLSIRHESSWQENAPSEALSSGRLSVY